MQRSSLRYEARQPSEKREQIERALDAFSVQYPRYGYRRIHSLLKRAGLQCSLRTVQRLRRAKGLKVSVSAPKRRLPPRPEAKLKSEHVNDVWCIDVVFDTTRGGGRVKFLTILDEHSHYCLDIVAGRRMGAQAVIDALKRLIAIHGAPKHLRCDNGGEFVAKILQRWLRACGINTRFIEPGSPWQNGINESFNGRFRDECLNRELLANLLEAQCVVRAFAHDYNTHRPHSSLNYRTPQDYRSELLSQAPGSGQARKAGPSLRHVLATNPT